MGLKRLKSGTVMCSPLLWTLKSTPLRTQPLNRAVLPSFNPVRLWRRQSGEGKGYFGI